MSVAGKTLMGLAVLVALALAAVAAGVPVPVASAQDGAAEAGTVEDGAADGAEQKRGQRGQRRAEQRAAFAAALAEELGLDAETVAAAIDKVHADLGEQRRAEHRARFQERLAAAVAEGTLTQEQADALLAAQEAGVLHGFRGRGFERRHERGHGPRGMAPPGPPGTG